MRYVAIAAMAAASVAFTSPAMAQSRKSAPQPSQLAIQATSGGEQPDVLLDVPNLSVDELTVEVDNLEAHISLDARLANLLKLTAGADVNIDNVKIQLKGVKAQATLVVRLDNVRAILERTLQTLDNNPQIITQLLSTVDNTVDTVGGVANNALPVVGGVANNAVNTVGGVAGNLLQNGQVLDLAKASLTELSRTVNATGQTVRQVRSSTGQILEVVTDSANRIVSSRAVR
ncbi:hypothetical protein [Allosphingosinicella vermicomposti]|uniref:hypothetical protein n=1 Tax=Allosphingosinicella vermicomposti TaxID=614671 RepID=UPI0018F86D13|nr:hypothetical protein [Allosphingosinicella vermicomposti]